jgi:hypothetical protein
MKNPKNYMKPLLKSPYSNLELLDRIKTSEWVKWQPCRGYGRLLAAVAMPTVLKKSIIKKKKKKKKIMAYLSLVCYWFTSFKNFAKNKKG